jgi:CheY-like chemotaxis protein
MGYILVIEDDEVMRDMVMQMLQREGFSVHCAENGSRAHKVLTRRQDTCMLIVTDIIMPEKDGLEFIMSLKNAQTAIPIIAVSGGGRIRPESYLDMAQQLGADHVFAKPFNRTDFLRTVRTIVGAHESVYPS